MRSSPSGRADRLSLLGSKPFAHRGLHGGSVPENSRAAFAAALGAGHGMELDVQASAEGEAFVFHDYDLGRLSEAEGPLARRTSTELKGIALNGNGETIPTLREVLALVGGKGPILVEVKSPDRHVARLCLAVFRALEGYRGPLGVMSFNPEVSRWFARNAPQVLRGLVVTESDRRGARGRLERHLALWRARPDFLAYDIRDLPSRFASARRRRGMPVFTWTVRSGEERARAALHSDQIIYEVVSAQ